jgi:hypothetical protein
MASKDKSDREQPRRDRYFVARNAAFAVSSNA